MDEEKTLNEMILESEYSERFDRIRKSMVVDSYLKNGSSKYIYHVLKSIDPIESLLSKIEAYKKSGNTEFLADVANLAMIEFMYPSMPKASYRPIT